MIGFAPTISKTLLLIDLALPAVTVGYSLVKQKYEEPVVV